MRCAPTWVAVAILGFAMVAEGVSLTVALKQINGLRAERSLWRWFRETRRSELIVVFAEDSAALVGLAIALAAVVATMVTGNGVYDAAGSIAIGILLVIVALLLGAEIKSLLIGESAAPTVRWAIRQVSRSARRGRSPARSPGAPDAGSRDHRIAGLPVPAA